MAAIDFARITEPHRLHGRTINPTAWSSLRAGAIVFSYTYSPETSGQRRAKRRKKDEIHASFRHGPPRRKDWL